MRGTVIQRGKGWSICYYIGKDEHGKWLQKWESGFPTKKEAQRVLRTRIDMIENSFSNNLSRSTVAGYLNYWLKVYCEPRLAPNTINGYRTNIEKHIIPYIGIIPLLKLQPKDIQTLYLTLQGKGLSSTSIRYVHNNLHKALQFAVKQQSLPRNPADCVEPPTVRKYEASVLKGEQVLQLLKACSGSEVYLPILLTVSLGLRRGEALALRWQDVDLDQKVVSIRHSALCKSQETFTISETKTKNSNRTLRLPDTLFDLLIVRYAELQKLRAEVGSGYNPLNLVCCRDSGQPFTCGVLHHQFHTALEKAGLPSIRFHDLRHTTATFMLQNAVPAKIVSAMLGHSSIGITMDTYSHVLTDMQEGATSKMNTLLKKLY